MERQSGPACISKLGSVSTMNSVSRLSGSLSVGSVGVVVVSSGVAGTSFVGLVAMVVDKLVNLHPAVSHPKSTSWVHAPYLHGFSKIHERPSRVLIYFFWYNLIIREPSYLLWPLPTSDPCEPKRHAKVAVVYT
jgi:hypothetical protein